MSVKKGFLYTSTRSTCTIRILRDGISGGIEIVDPTPAGALDF